jgi:hypothetical protein
MASDPQRMQRLAVAAQFCMFDKKLRSSGNASIIWGVLNLLVGGLLLAADDYWGGVSLLLGIGLIAAGIYQRTVRHAEVIIISAATLAVLALWNFTLLVLAVRGKVELALGGRTFYWAIAQAWGAVATWKTYSSYASLLQESDPTIVEQVRGYVNELKRAKPQQTLDLIEFEANAGFLQGTHRYRLKPFDDLYLVTRSKMQFRSASLEDVGFVPRAEVILIPVSGDWSDKKIRVSVQLGPAKVKRVSITPEMALRINPSARANVAGTL